MKPSKHLILTLGIAAVLSGCSTTPRQIEELETARAIVPQVENSPRAGVAAENISAARRALDTANRLVEDGGKLEDIQFEAAVANKNAQIANEKILTAQARDEIAKGEAARQQVLLQAREREAQTSAAQAELAAAQATEAQQRARGLEEELRDLKAKQTERGLVLTLGDVLFDTGKATLKPGAYATIDRLAAALKEAPNRKVTIEGHTDSVGSDEYNQSLSEQRAHSVQAALMERGVAGNQIAAMGKGESFPVANNDHAAGRQQNRRVELIFAQDPSRVASD